MPRMSSKIVRNMYSDNMYSDNMYSDNMYSDNIYSDNVYSDNVYSDGFDSYSWMFRLSWNDSLSGCMW